MHWFNKTNRLTQTTYVRDLTFLHRFNSFGAKFQTPFVVCFFFFFFFFHFNKLSFGKTFICKVERLTVKQGSIEVPYAKHLRGLDTLKRISPSFS